MKKEKQEKRFFTVLIVCIVVMALIFGWMSKDLGGSNQYIDKNSKQSLSELMEQMERAYRNRLEITYEQIDSIEKYMFGDGEREAELKDYQNYFDSMESDMVRDIVFVNDEGEYLCMRGLNGRIQMQDGLSELFGENKGIAQYCTWKDGEEIFIIAKSVDSFLVNGEEYEAIAFLFRPQIINDLFVTSAYNGQANIYVMDENGEVAYASINNEPGEVTINYNLFDSYHEQKIMNKKDYEKVKSDYAERSSGCITLERENESDYFSYRALKGTQYMIACEVDSTIVQNVLADYQIMMLHIWLTVTCIIIAMLAALGISILWIYNEKNKVAYARRNAMQQAEAAEKLEEVNTALEETVLFANTAKAEAERANEAKSVFLSNMSHDMRTPLNAVMGLATLISRDAENSDCVREYARKLTYSGEHLLGLINDVLDMSKIEAGKTVLNIMNTNIAELVEELDMIIRSQTREKGQEFMIHVHRIETEEVEADKLRLKQILLNILSNAVKYTPKGGKIVFDITEVPKKSADSFATTKPEATIDPATKVGYNVDFEDVTIGTKTEDAITGDGIKGVVLRGHKKADDGGVGTSKDYLDVVDGSDLPVEGNNTHVLHLHREDKTWQGPMMNITDKLDEGCIYELKADVFCQNTDLMCSYQEQPLEELSPSYGNFGPTSGTITKIPKGKWNTVTFTISVPDDKFYYALYFESYNGNGNDDIYLDNITLTKTLQTNPDKTIASL